MQSSRNEQRSICAAGDLDDSAAHQTVCSALVFSTPNPLRRHADSRAEREAPGQPPASGVVLVVSEPRLRVLRAIEGLRALYGYPPTVREIAEAVGLRSLKGTSEMLARIERAGLVERAAARRRSVVLTAEGRAVIGVETPADRVPRLLRLLARAASLLGTVAAGTPLLEEIAQELAS